MSVINRVPRGWLGTLDAKTGGRTPVEPLTNLTPTFDLTPNYLADINLATEATVAAFGTVGTLGVLVTVPAGELWYVYGVSGIVVSTGAGETNYHFALGLDVATGFGAHIIQPMPQSFIGAGLAAGETAANGVTFADPWLAGPGVSFGIWFYRPPVNITMSCTTSVLHRSVTI